MSSSVPVKAEIDDEYSNSSESSGPVDLSEGALRVFTDHPENRKEDKPPNQIIEVLVEGKIQLIEIQPVAEVSKDEVPLRGLHLELACLIIGHLLTIHFDNLKTLQLHR